jgi:cell division protein FtsW (lipid II flippase)
MDEMKPVAPSRGHHHADNGTAAIASYATGGALVLLVVVAVLSYAGIIVTSNLFGALAVLLTVIVFIMAYFGSVSLRTAILFFATAAMLYVGINYLTKPYVSAEKYQAVFLTNGQVYFGHLHNSNSSQPTLTHIFYLQSKQSPQGDTTTQSTNANNLSLVKLGNELHGPTDMMAINKGQILFWENLKDDGKVVQAIKSQTK